MTRPAIEWMSSLDSFFYFTEGDGVNHMHVGGFALVEGRAPTLAVVAKHLAAKTAQISRYRQVARTVPLHLGRPFWVDAPTFDIDQHVSATRLAHPGHDAFTGQIASFISEPLERSIPLWQIRVVAGVGPDEWGVIWKIHHSMVDGVSGTELLTILFDTEEKPKPDPTPEPWRPREAPASAAALGSSLTGLVKEAGGAAVALRPRSLGKLGRVAKSYAGLTLQSLTVDWHSPLCGPIGPDRAYDFTTTSFASIKTIRAALGGTVNDVVLTAVIQGFTDLLQGRGRDVTGKSLHIMVPVALRSRDAEGRPLGDGTMETKASALVAKLPLDIEDPVERLKHFSKYLADLKETDQAEAVTSINELTQLLPGTVSSVAVRAMSKVPQRAVHSTVTNVQGPPMELYLAGRRIHTIGSYAPPFPIGARTSVGVYSYQGRLVFGVTGDRDSMHDIDRITAGIDRTLAALGAAAQS
jgi:diacylglycerol O-acyltransferase / wax synthase